MPPNKQYDFSDFDEPKKEEPKQKQAAYDFSDFDEPKQEQVEVTPVDEGDSALENLTEGAGGSAIGGAVGGIAGYATRGAAKSINKHASGAGKLSGPQMDFITANPEAYKSAKPFDDMMHQVQNMAKDSYDTTGAVTRNYGNYIRKGAQELKDIGVDSAGKARASLPGSPRIVTKDFYKLLADEANNFNYGVDLPDSNKPQMLKQQLNQIQPQLAELKKQDDAERKLQQTLGANNAPENPKADIRQEADGINRERKALRNDQKETKILKKLETNQNSTKLKDSLENIKNKIEDFKLADQVEESKLQQIGQFEAEQGISKSKDKVAKVQSKGEQLVSNTNREVNDAYNKSLNTPAEIREASEGVLDNRKLGKGYAQGLEGAIDDIRGTDTFPAERMDSLIQEVRSGKVYGEKGSPNGEFDKKLASAMRNKQLGPKTHPVYDEMMRISSGTQSAQEALKEATKVDYGVDGNSFLSKASEDKVGGYLSRPDEYPSEHKRLNSALDEAGKYVPVPSPLGQERIQQTTKLDSEFQQFGIKFDEYGNVSMSDAGKENLKDLTANPTENADKIKKLEALLDEARTVSAKPYLPSGELDLPSGKAMVNDMTASGIKQIVNDSKVSNMNKQQAVKAIAKTAAGMTAGGITGGPPAMIIGAAAGGGSDVFGTKLQEMLAQFKSGKTYKGFVKPLLENAPKVGAIAGTVLGGIGAASAAEKGEITQDQVPVATALEAIAPPLTSGVESMKSANQAFDSSIAQGDSELMANGKAAVGSVTGFVKPFTDGASSVVPAVDKLLEGGVRQAQKVGGSAVDMLNQAPNDARARMEQQMKSLDSLKPKEDPKKGNDFLNFVAKKPEALKELADQLTGAGQSFAGPLNKAAEGSESQRAAILFGLYQQPAFRSLIGEGSLLNQNIPGVKKKDEDELTAVKVPRPM